MWPSIHGKGGEQTWTLSFTSCLCGVHVLISKTQSKLEWFTFVGGRIEIVSQLCINAFVRVPNSLTYVCFWGIWQERETNFITLQDYQGSSARWYFTHVTSGHNHGIELRQHELLYGRLWFLIEGSGRFKLSKVSCSCYVFLWLVLFLKTTQKGRKNHLCSQTYRLAIISCILWHTWIYS